MRGRDVPPLKGGMGQRRHIQWLDSCEAAARTGGETLSCCVAKPHGREAGNHRASRTHGVHWHAMSRNRHDPGRVSSLDASTMAGQLPSRLALTFKHVRVERPAVQATTADQDEMAAARMSRQ
eukprot:363446-Chlamydomonas_euryale.AAC.3